MGVAHFTVGQRKGLGLGGKGAHYVVGLEADTAKVVVGNRSDLERESFLAERVLWSVPMRGDQKRLSVQVRHRQRAVPCRVVQCDEGVVEVFPEDPAGLGAVPPGQAAVFYDGDVLQGGGWLL